MVWQEQAGVFTEDGRDLTIAFREGACKTLELARKTALNGCFRTTAHLVAVKIYDGSLCRRLVTGVGVTAALLKKHGIKVIAETDWSMQRRSNDV